MKQAVVLIHGIGEQKPMDTLRAFVGAVLGPAEDGRDAYWSKPDPMSELFELRRLQSTGRLSTHFYEYYWAYNVDGTKVFQILHWLAALIVRRSRDVPPSAKALWLVSRLLAALLLLLAFAGTFATVREWFNAQPVMGAIWIGAMLAVSLLQYFLVSYLGDAARYLSPLPQNIKLRQTIRSEGVRLLQTLHEREEYDRIIVVGHSLGSVIGYDIITHLWQKYNETYLGLAREEVKAAVRDCMDRRVSPQPVIRDVISKAGEALRTDDGEGALAQFQREQVNAWREQRGLGNPWLITDFITLGSPLVHGTLLLARSKDDFESRMRQRELPGCPPQRDDKGYAYSGPTPIDVGEGRKFTPLVLHHAAPFAVTRWTNFYFPARLGLFGDFVGGPLRAAFGPGIRDVPVRTSAWAGLAGFTALAHTQYWHVGDDTDGAPQSAQPGPVPALSGVKSALALKYLRKFQPRKVGAVDGDE
jgi:hypothetical protein